MRWARLRVLAWAVRKPGALRVATVVRSVYASEFILAVESWARGATDAAREVADAAVRLDSFVEFEHSRRWAHEFRPAAQVELSALRRGLSELIEAMRAAATSPDAETQLRARAALASVASTLLRLEQIGRP